jgi:hypothetical protein
MSTCKNGAVHTWLGKSAMGDLLCTHYARPYTKFLTLPEGLDPGLEIELWWQDEARIGQKNKITRRWAQRGTRPSAPHDQRTLSAYICIPPAWTALRVFGDIVILRS